MEEERNELRQNAEGSDDKVRTMIREVIEEFTTVERAKAEPVQQAELKEERKRREQLERRVNELIAENERSRHAAEETERHSAIRDELRRLGVTKVELGFRAVRDDIYRSEEGSLLARGESGEMGLQEYLARFVRENPELLPARIAGGSGASGAPATPAGAIDLENIRPGMDPEQLARVRREIAQALSRT